MATLYQITDDFLRLMELAEDPEVDPEVFADTMEGLEGELEIKAEGYACVIKELEAEAEKFDREVKRLMAQAGSIRNNVKRMKESLMHSMCELGKTKIPTEHFRISVARNGGKQPLFITPELADIPEEFLIRRPEPDKDKIREALEAGKELGFARLEERGQHLSIR